VVDEDPAVHRLVNALFAPEGHEVESVRSGEQALQLARDGEYDMIIADVRMAAGSSQPFTRALLQACPHTHSRLVVACSGEDDLSGIPTEQAIRRVTKPFSPRDLRTVAQEILQ
jgi:CheY-like chemotaxis protein